ncbi:MAG: 2-oxoacid:acceptor oxidoreductase family protein [Chloroflexi bacterium]|jgi:2-oxoglutarate ferredoxin oxidoreductase subunit gamma|nr:2-oxoacid:acceptor oxidoreductase family protein [Chloroflexota bacterium]MBT7081229.1 2-oxoacid:acceptor oxidoreductase family protein [Chloroflexota bacterium]MBT7290020.1 2-oxoacid:acceptor oxidoreductase family protein [Chloroflexota bacterium]
MKKVIVSGEGGQGVRVIGHTLAVLLTNLGYEVSLLNDYDSSVRGAMSVAYLVFDDKPIDNPVVGNDADILLKLSDKGDGFASEKTVCQTGLCTDEQIPFEQLGEERFGKAIFGNMIALGKLIALVGIEIPDEALMKVLPLKYRDENLLATHYGYSLTEGDLGRGARSKKNPERDFASNRPGYLPK